jgi:DNA-3-methyladenine glycosylase II
LNPIVNPRDIQKLLKTDKLFVYIHELYGPPPNWSRPEGFVSLAQIILEQQVSLASAKAHFLKLEAYLPAFTPAEMIRLTDAEMRRCQISRQKMVYLRALSQAVLGKTLEFHKLGQLNQEEVRQKLTHIKGIGEWTTDIYQMFCLQSKDLFPIGDIAVVNTVKELSRIKTREGILARSEKWKPLRSLATYYLWHHYLSKRKKNV